MSRLTCFAVVTLVSALGAPPASAASAASAPPGYVYPAGCANPADSALSQYCEIIPAATGGQTPQPGAPALAGALPPAIAGHLARGAGLRALLTLPAGKRLGRHGIAQQVPGNGSDTIAVGSFSPIPAWLAAVLAATALLLLGLKAINRRQEHRKPTVEQHLHE